MAKICDVDTIPQIFCTEHYGCDKIILVIQDENLKNIMVVTK